MKGQNMTNEEKLRVYTSVDKFREEASQTEDQNKLFQLLDLAICGHMGTEQKRGFIADARARGLFNAT